ncbi:MAG: hypothetical protein U0559_02570 [Anaerolineae bacterium]
MTRQQQDEYSVQSHKKAFAATRMGKFKDEIVPVEIVKKVAGQEVAKGEITQDETINAGLSIAKAAMYLQSSSRAAASPASTYNGISDGASAMLIMSCLKKPQN